tara:strand:+ start:677 stop:1495 length:819 start_codon:yes stop_codon:yes gene_type:complete
MIKSLVSIYRNSKSFINKVFTNDNYSELFVKRNDNNFSRELKKYRILKNFKKISNNHILECETYINKKLNLNSKNNKSVYVNNIGSRDFDVESILLKIALNDKILTIVQNYLGERSILWDLRILKSENINNLSIQSDQLWHRDKYDSKSLRLWLSLSDCNNKCGPFQYLPFSISKNIFKSYFGRLDDNYIKKNNLINHIDFLYSKKGDLSLIDVSKLLHCGSRVNIGYSRLVFNAIYTTAKPLKEPTFDLKLRDKLFKNPDLSDIQKSFLSY